MIKYRKKESRGQSPPRSHTSGLIITRIASSRARNVIAALLKRLAHRSPNVQLYTLSLAESLSKNCGIELHRELASRAFTGALEKLVVDRVRPHCSGIAPQSYFISFVLYFANGKLKSTFDRQLMRKSVGGLLASSLCG